MLKGKQHCYTRKELTFKPKEKNPPCIRPVRPLKDQYIESSVHSLILNTNWQYKSLHLFTVCMCEHNVDSTLNIPQ